MRVHRVLMSIAGPVEERDAFVARHLGRRELTFATLVPVPAGLEDGWPSDVADAHDALFGEWSAVARRDMLRDAARERGHPFPLASREQVLACLESIVPYGPEALERARRFEANVAAHGAGEVSAWMKLHWGVDCDATGTIAEPGAEATVVSFGILSVPADKLLRRYSNEHRALTFDVAILHGGGKKVRRVVLANGRSVPGAADVAPDELAQRIAGFRRRAGVAWLSRFAPAADVGAAIVVDDEGVCRLAGTTMALDFALARLRAGEAIDHLRGRFPEIGAAHARALVALYDADRAHARAERIQ